MREERPESASEQDETAREIVAEAEPSFFADPKRLIQTAIAVVLLLVAIYVLVPKIFDLQDALGKIEQGDPVWIAVGIAFCVAHVRGLRRALPRRRRREGDPPEWGESYQITMAGLAATRLFSAGGAGGILLTYWALRKAGMERRQSVCRMVAFLVVLYSVYLASLVIFGVLLRTGVLSGDAPLSGTVIPAALAALAIFIGLLIALLPDDFERRIERHTSGRFGRIAKRIATAPATFAQGTRTAIAFVRHPSAGALAFGGAIGFWGANIAILWASFHAFDVSVPLGGWSSSAVRSSTTAPLTVTPRTVRSPDPARGRVDRLRRQPAARLRDRQRRGRHRPRVPPRRRPAPGALAQLGAGRRADGAPRGAALAVAGDALPRQPPRRPPRPGHRVLAGVRGLGGRLDRGPPRPARLHRPAGHRLRRRPEHHLAHPRRRLNTRPMLEALAVVQPVTSHRIDTGWLAESTHGGLLLAVFGAITEPTSRCCAGCTTTPGRRWPSPSTSPPGPVERGPRRRPELRPADAGPSGLARGDPAPA